MKSVGADTKFIHKYLILHIEYVIEVVPDGGKSYHKKTNIFKRIMSRET